jgi:hypothetical protein
VSIARVFSKLDDWLNPIVVKELRQSVRSRAVTSALVLFLLLQLLIIGVYVWNYDARVGRDAEMLEGGRELFQVIQAIMLGTCLLIPAYTGIRLGAERSDTNVDLLFISTLKPRAIVSGKLFSAVVLALLVFSACTPFLTFTYLLRGLDIPTILVILMIDFLAVLWAIQWAIFLAVIPVPLAVRILFILAGLLGLYGLMVGTVVETSRLLQSGLGVSMDSWDFWGPWLAAVLLILAGVGLLFVWSVAILSPPSANRALRVRLYLIGLWLVTGVAVLWVHTGARGRGLFESWLASTGMLFALQVVISINERDSWGPRVARSIPRRRWLRPPVFLVYSGSAGGILFALLMFTLTFAVGYYFVHHQAAGYAPLEVARLLRLLLLVFLYAYCYGMSALLLQRTLLAHHLKPIATWLVALLLLGLGSVVPYLAAYFVAPESMRYGQQDSTWLLTNPFASIEDAMREGRRQSTYSPYGLTTSPSLSDILDVSILPFLGVWAGVVTLLALPWFVRQVSRFRPLRRGRKERVPPPEDVLEALPVGEESGP